MKIKIHIEVDPEKKYLTPIYADNERVIDNLDDLQKLQGDITEIVRHLSRKYITGHELPR